MKKSTMKKFSLTAVVLGLTVGGAGVLINQANASTGAADTQTGQNNNQKISSINLSQTDAINKFNEKFGSVSIEEINLSPKKVNTFMKLEVLTHKMSTRQRLMQVVATLLNQRLRS